MSSNRQRRSTCSKCPERHDSGVTWSPRRFIVLCGAASLVVGALSLMVIQGLPRNSIAIDGALVLRDVAVNDTCPICEGPIDGRTYAVYLGKTFGFSCADCRSDFSAWDAQRKDGFFRTFMPQPNRSEHAEQIVRLRAERVGDPYLLSVCVVSGEKLGNMGDPVVRVYEGREVRFCCEQCIEKFEAKSGEYWREVNEHIRERQISFYPIETCVVSDEPLGDQELGPPINLVYHNRLIRFCCDGCIDDFIVDSHTVLRELDEAIIAKQRDRYPFDTCPVSGEELGSMGEPFEKTYGNRLVRFCCMNCLPNFENAPAAFIAALDSAWSDAKSDAREIQDEGQESHKGNNHAGG